MNKQEIEQLMEDTEGAYSRDNYPEAAWRGAIKFLDKAGFHRQAIIETLYSKWMRWGHDSMYGRNGKQPTGKATAEFLAGSLDNIKEMLLTECGINATDKNPDLDSTKLVAPGTNWTDL